MNDTTANTKKIRLTLPEETLDTPEVIAAFGHPLRVRGMTLGQRFELAVSSKETQRFDMVSGMLATCVLDPGGLPIYDADEWDVWGGSGTNFVLALELWNRVWVLSGLVEEDSAEKKELEPEERIALSLALCFGCTLHELATRMSSWEWNLWMRFYNEHPWDGEWLRMGMLMSQIANYAGMTRAEGAAPAQPSDYMPPFGRKRDAVEHEPEPVEFFSKMFGVPVNG